MALVIMCESNIHKLSSGLTSLMAWHLANKQQKLIINTYHRDLQGTKPFLGVGDADFLGYTGYHRLVCLITEPIIMCESYIHELYSGELKPDEITAEAVL